MVRKFSPSYFHVTISIGILESNSLSQSTPSRTKWTLVYLLMLYNKSFMFELPHLYNTSFMFELPHYLRRKFLTT